MKIFFSEFKSNYSRYHFPYQVWLLKEEADNKEKIYQNGFLPMRNRNNVYFLARSLRVDLNNFDLSSENRRILNKTKDIKSELIPLSKFSYTPKIQKFCKDYCNEKLGQGLFSTGKIKEIFLNGVFNSVFVFTDLENNEIGYVVCFIGETLLHYAYAFYDLEFLKLNLGARMMLEAVNWSKSNNKNYAYLGTCYEESALYKTEFSGIEFFNGFRWSNNLAELKKLISGFIDNEEYLLKNKSFLEEFYQGDLEKVLSTYGIRVNL